MIKDHLKHLLLVIILNENNDIYEFYVIQDILTIMFVDHYTYFIKHNYFIPNITK